MTARDGLVAVFVVLIGLLVYSLLPANPVTIAPQPADIAAKAELASDREALRDTVRDTVWRVIRKAARVDTIKRTDTLQTIILLADSALTCYQQRDSLLRADSLRRAQPAQATCQATTQWRGYAMFAGGTVLGYLIGNLK